MPLDVKTQSDKVQMTYRDRLRQLKHQQNTQTSGMAFRKVLSSTCDYV